MREMDLIPEDYRREQNTRKLLIGFGTLYVVIIVGLIGGKVFQDSRTSTMNNQIKTLEKQQETLIGQQKIVDELRIKKTAVQNQLSFVKMIQQGGGAGQMFLVFDRVLQHEQNKIWMDGWQYTAANLQVDSQIDEKDSDDHMSVIIRGQAIDHEALSSFVERLIAEPEITDVQVKNTSMVDKDKTTVKFDMEII